jgi:HK97 family phage prohead protease
MSQPTRTTILPDVERRSRPLAATDFTLRAEPDGADPVFTGHAAVFNVRTAIGNPLTWGFYEEIAPGAFTKTLKEGDARFLVDHDTALLVARVTAGDLRLGEDDIGLNTESDLDQEVSYVRDLTVNVRKRRITGMSFGFEVVKDDWTTVDAGTLDNGDTVEAELRTIREVKLYEVSAVTFPAYEETDAALRAVRCRSNPDPLGRRAALLRRESTDREPADATRGDKPSEPAVSTRMTAKHVDLAMRGYAARYRLSL